MTATLSADDIAAEVRSALEATLRLDAYPERLWPYTQAELNFLNDFVARALTRVMLKANE